MIVFETAGVKKSFVHKFVLENCDAIISGTFYGTKHILEYTNVRLEKIFTKGGPTQIDGFIKNTPLYKENYRQMLGFKTNKSYILYAGKVGIELTQVDYFIKAATTMPNVNFVIVGANNTALKIYQEIKRAKKISNLSIVPFVPLPEYYKYVKAADVLVSYYPATFHNKFHLGPGKAGIYFSSNNPVIFSKLPSLEVLFSEDLVFYAKPDDFKELVGQIKFVLENKDLAKAKSQNAFQFAKENSYLNFATDIVKFLCK